MVDLVGLDLSSEEGMKTAELELAKLREATAMLEREIEIAKERQAEAALTTKE